jgi:molybdopterin molybdotransferase
MYLSKLMAVKKTLEIIYNVKRTCEKEKIALDGANMRVLAEDIQVLNDVPPFDRAAMDGYAVIAEDTRSSSESKPTFLEVVDDIGAGYISKYVLDKGEAVKIATGAQMPQGSNSVVMEEFTEDLQGKIKITNSVDTHENVALTGEDLIKGETILKEGQILGPHHLAIIASSGYDQIKVFIKPKIGVIITGNELIEPSEQLKPGKIINSNKYALKALIEDSLANPSIIHSDDDLDMLMNIFEDFTARYDGFITTGGTAIGKGDLIIDVINELGEVLVHGVAIKPGKPFGFGIINEKPIFMLSGYPVAAAVQFDMFVRNYILKMQNITKKFDLIKCIAGSHIYSNKGKCNIIRAKLDKGIVNPIRTKAGINKSIVLSNCYIILDEDIIEVNEGENCNVLEYRTLKIC